MRVYVHAFYRLLAYNPNESITHKETRKMAVPRIQASIPVTTATDVPITANPASSKSSLEERKNKNDASIHSSSSITEDESLVLLKANPFLDPRVASYWSDVYEACEYECRHVFDPTLKWTEEEEKKIIRKIDLRVTLWAVRPSENTIACISCGCVFTGFFPLTFVLLWR